MPVSSAAGRKLLPLVRVFTYKYNDSGFLSKLKAQTCVKGDLKTDSLFDDDYAATLAIRTFCALMGITAAFDLEAKQFDVTSAFLNSKLDKKMNTKAPDGYERQGECWLLLRGFFQSPTLSPALAQRSYLYSHQSGTSPCCWRAMSFFQQVPCPVFLR